ncbi:hypothetical protein [Cohnella faecalis]|uniref:hypothetical protein n=1 Tax=Cohnella faecalis TaxID=2315694 RepID=UPI001314E53C|nr:hypothetical protein [Cohnella faecalis]
MTWFSLTKHPLQTNENNYEKNKNHNLMRLWFYMAGARGVAPLSKGNPSLKIHPEKLRDSETEPNNIRDDKKPLFGPSAYAFLPYYKIPNHNSV